MTLLRSVYAKRPLVFEMARRELTDFHAGQSGGALWLVVHPLLFFAVYAFLFTAVFKVRIGGNGPSDYLLYLFAGLAPWLLTQEVLTRSALSMPSNIAIVKKVLFPSEVLVAKAVAAASGVQLILLSVVVIYTIVVRGSIPATFLLFPVLLGLHLTLLWGLALLLAALTPYFRDIPEFIRVFVTVNVFLVPILYLPDMVPSSLRVMVLVNPFSSLILCYQDVFYFAAIAHPWAWIALAGFASASLLAGSYVFVRLRHHFASVL